MEEIIMLGTGHAMVTKCYNTCFLLKNDYGTMMVDAGGGNQIISRMEQSGENWEDITSIFITHAHTDHITGIVWVLRCIGMLYRNGRGHDVVLYGNDECISVVTEMCEGMLSSLKKPFDRFGGHLKMHTLGDGERFVENKMDFTAFDICSEEKKQYGFRCRYGKEKSLVCLGDESYRESSRKYAENCDWMMHEAFSAEEKPGPKHHGSAARAASNASMLGAKNLIMYHMEDSDLAGRKEKYRTAAAGIYSGGIYIPDDLDKISI